MSFSLVNIGTAATGTGTITPTVPVHSSGDLLLLWACARTAAETSDVDPSGWALLAPGNATADELWWKIGSGSETNPSISFSGTSRCVAYITALRSTTGFSGSLLCDSATGITNATFQRYQALTVTEDNLLTIQFAVKIMTTADANVPTGVSASSGYTAMGFAADTSGPFGLAISAQFKGQTTATNLAQNDETITGNNDNNGSRGLSVSLRAAASSSSYIYSPFEGGMNILGGNL